ALARVGEPSGKPPGERDADARDFCAHVDALLRACFGHLGLRTVRSHQLTAQAPAVLHDALADSAACRGALAAGAARLAAVSLPASFDAADPRPLLLES